ncbi:MAG: HesA/MoeB/ThiF family protein [Acidiferrobacterales bacterium]|nr:HesA/MoeB/ThiF family protein [Acidiferrobacterales bacterium]
MSVANRYSRQTQVTKFGEKGQQTLNQTSTTIVGVGGLGCQVATLLAGAGIGKINLIDHDQVSLTNLHRQILFREKDIGEKKAAIAARELVKLNSDIQISYHCQRLNFSNVEELIDDATIVIDAADNFVTSYILSDYCFNNRIPLISASVNSTFGWVGVFCGNSDNPAPSIRAVFPELAKQITSCDTVGVTGPSVGIIGSVQAQEALKVALNDDAQLSGKLLYFDLWNYRQHIVDFSKSIEPDQNQFKFISAAEVMETDLVVDVRNLAESAATPLDFNNKVSIPISELASKADELPHDLRLVLACASGQRALIAAQQLSKHGFENLSVLLPS